MGIGLSEYRTAIGTFAWIASNANLSLRKKSRQKTKSRRIRKRRVFASGYHRVSRLKSFARSS